MVIYELRILSDVACLTNADCVRFQDIWLGQRIVFVAGLHKLSPKVVERNV